MGLSDGQYDTIDGEMRKSFAIFKHYAVNLFVIISSKDKAVSYQHQDTQRCFQGGLAFWWEI